MNNENLAVPELAAVDIQGHTRGAFIARGAMAAGPGWAFLPAPSELRPAGPRPAEAAPAGRAARSPVGRVGWTRSDCLAARASPMPGRDPADPGSDWSGSRSGST